MSSIKPRVKVPKEVSIDEIIEIKTLIRHPMHSGRMKDTEGNTIPKQIINAKSEIILKVNPAIYIKAIAASSAAGIPAATQKAVRALRKTNSRIKTRPNP